MANEYTRVAKNSCTIIDYVITNNYGIMSENCRTNKISDHELINISLARLDNMNNKAKTIHVFKYDKHTFNAMLKDIIKYDDSKDLNQNVNLFGSGLESVIQRLTIGKQIHLNNKARKWYNSELQAMKKIFKS